MKFRTFSFFILSALLLTSCSGTTGPDETTTLPQSTEITQTETALPPIEIRDFNGKEFTFFIRWATDGWDWNVDDLFVEEQNGEPVNDAVWKRNNIVQERYNCSISQVKSNDMWNSANIVRTSILAGDKAYDGIIASGRNMVALGIEGLLYDLNSFDELDLTRSYWNPSIIEELTLGKKLFFAMGDLSATDNRAVRCLYFNKNLFSKYNLDDPYTLVRSGEWTIEKFLKMVSEGRLDLDGNGEYNENDQWGLYVQPSIGANLFFASEGRFIIKDKDDRLVVSFGSEGTVDLMSAIADRIKSAYDSMLISYDYQKMIPSFAEGHSLFYSEVSLFIERFRQYDFDVGMIPMPKFDENQENYCQYADGACLNYAGIPIDSPAPDDTALLLEALSAESPETLTKAYYDICLTGKSIRDEESAEMLDIIFNNYTIDYADLFDFSFYGSLNNALRGELDVASTVASTLESAKTATNEINEKIASK